MNMVQQQIECKTCPWNKLCIDPPTMTKEDVEAKLEEAKPSKGKDEKSVMGSVMSVMFFGGKDRECRACPVFIDKLRGGPELSAKIKEIMQSY